MTAVVWIFQFLGDLGVGFVLFFYFKFNFFLQDVYTFLLLFVKEVDETPGLKNLP